jgi:hypothetical protein
VLTWLSFQVLRQGSFIKKMHDLGWTEPSYFNSGEDEVVLQHAVARYHAYVLPSIAVLAGYLVDNAFIDFWTL